MVLEQFLDRKIVINHTLFTFILSAVYVFVAYAVQNFFFPGESLATVLLVTILLVPSLHHLIVIEEKIERTGSAHFFKRHKTIIKCYTGAFLGLLFGFFILGTVNAQTLNYQNTQLEQTHLKPELVTGFLNAPYTPTTQTAMSVFTHNLTYLLAGFALSIFYGAGAIFLVIFNASFFAAFIITITQTYNATLTAIAASLFHLIPESAGFILTSIAGATLSRAIIHEKIRAQAFKNVLQNCVKLLILAIVLILTAAFIETYLTAQIFHALI